MNNIVTNYLQIIEFAKNTGVPINKERGLIREYLQSKFIYHLYNQKASSKLSFVGGTSLRLLRNLPRFSEDLDFDNLGLSDKEISNLIENVVTQFRIENIETELRIKQEAKNSIDIRFPNLLFDLKITTNPKEKVMIKFDYASLWKNQKTEVVLLNKFGFLEQILTNTLDVMLTEKLTAYVNRKRLQPRDMYDVVWLFSQGAKLDKKFVKDNNLTQLINKALKRFKSEEKSLNSFENRLKPFLFNEEDSKKIRLLEDILNQLK